MDGVAGFATAQVGDLVGPSTGFPRTISQVDPIKAVATGSEQAYSKFVTRYADPDKLKQYSESLEFELVLAGGSVYSQKGKFCSVDRNVDVKTGSIRFEATFPNPGNILRPGQFGRVRATTDTKEGALLVPQRAVRELQGSYQVAVISSDSKASMRPVKVGERFGQMWKIKEGLKPGEKVVVEGLQKVHEGAPVTAKPWIPPEGTPVVFAVAAGLFGSRLPSGFLPGRGSGVFIRVCNFPSRRRGNATKKSSKRSNRFWRRHPVSSTPPRSSDSACSPASRTPTVARSSCP